MQRLIMQPPIPRPTVRSTDIDQQTDPTDLWERYRADRGRAERNRLIERYHPLVSSVVAGCSLTEWSDIDRDSLHSNGVLGLIDAIEKYEPALGPFETYARKRILGAIHDEERREQAKASIPRSVRRRARAIGRVVAYLEARLERSPTIDEVAAELGVPEARVRKWLQDRDQVRALSIHQQTEDGARPTEEWLCDSTDLTPESHFDVEEIRLRLAHAIASLPEQTRVLLALIYREEFTYLEASQFMCIGVTRVSQLQTAGLEALRLALAGPVVDAFLAES